MCQLTYVVCNVDGQFCPQAPLSGRGRLKAGGSQGWPPHYPRSFSVIVTGAFSRNVTRVSEGSVAGLPRVAITPPAPAPPPTPAPIAAPLPPPARAPMTAPNAAPAPTFSASWRCDVFGAPLEAVGLDRDPLAVRGVQPHQLHRQRRHAPHTAAADRSTATRPPPARRARR